MEPEIFANILRPLPSNFNINRFINAFDRYIVYLSKEQLDAYAKFIDRQSNWNEFYIHLFPGQPFPKDYDKFVDYKEKRKKQNREKDKGTDEGTQRGNGGKREGKTKGNDRGKDKGKR